MNDSASYRALLLNKVLSHEQIDWSRVPKSIGSYFFVSLFNRSVGCFIYLSDEEGAGFFMKSKTHKKICPAVPLTLFFFFWRRHCLCQILPNQQCRVRFSSTSFSNEVEVFLHLLYFTLRVQQRILPELQYFHPSSLNSLW